MDMDRQGNANYREYQKKHESFHKDFLLGKGERISHVENLDKTIITFWTFLSNKFELKKLFTDPQILNLTLDIQTDNWYHISKTEKAKHEKNHHQIS